MLLFLVHNGWGVSLRIHDALPTTHGKHLNPKHRQPYSAGKNGRSSAVQRGTGRSNHKKGPVTIPTPTLLLASMRCQELFRGPPCEGLGPKRFRGRFSEHRLTVLRDATTEIKVERFVEEEALYRARSYTPTRTPAPHAATWKPGRHEGGCGEGLSSRGAVLAFGGASRRRWWGNVF